MDTPQASQEVTPTGDARKQSLKPLKGTAEKQNIVQRDDVSVKVEADQYDELPDIVDHTERSKADLDLFDSMFESWKNHDSFLKLEAEDLRARLNISEKMNAVATARIQDLGTTVDMLQRAMDSIDNGLNLVDSLTKDNNLLKNVLKKEKELNKCLEAEHKEKTEQLQLDVVELKSQHDKQVEELRSKFSKEADKKGKQVQSALEEKEKEIEKLKKDKQSQYSVLTFEYEEKIAALQRQKLTAVTNQQQQSSNNQEIFRRKLQHMKQEHEQEVSGLKTQIRNLQAQLSLLQNKEKTTSVQARQKHSGQQKRVALSTTPQRVSISGHLSRNTPMMAIPRQTYIHSTSGSSSLNNTHNAFTRAGILETDLPTSNRMTATANGKVASSGPTLRKMRKF